MTLTNENPQLVSRILFGFFHSFRNLKFDNTFKENFGIDSFLEVNLTNESLDIQLPQNLTDIINQCLVKCQKYSATPQAEPEFERFIELVKAYRCFFGAIGPVFKDKELIESIDQQQDQFMPTLVPEKVIAESESEEQLKTKQAVTREISIEDRVAA